MGTRHISRRRFSRAAALSAAAIGLPTVIPAHVLGSRAPSDTLRIGCIGTGRMGHGDMTECLNRGLDPTANAHIVAVCDLDRQRAEHAKRAATGIYAQQLAERPQPTIEVFDDYRELLSRDDIDGVTISTPDHWHALVAIAAAEAGKAVYLQKPLTYTIVEGRQLVKAVKRNQVVLQTGSQQRSSRDFRRACELVRNGRIGKLHTIRVLLPTDSGHGKSTTTSAPTHFNYDMWLGPTPQRPYTEDRVHPQVGYTRPGWLQIEPYCRGMITGWGAHMFDIAQWGHGSDETGPVEMEATAEFPKRGLFNVHTTFHAEGRYADGVRLIAESGTPAGVTFEGDAGWVAVTRSDLKAEPRAILSEEIGEDEVRLYESGNHMLNYLQCTRSGQAPICPVEIGHRSNSLCVITHLAMKLDRKLRWDPQRERFRNDDLANTKLDYDHRQPWTLH